EHDRPEWIAAARFYDRYITTLALQSAAGPLYDSAEIVRAAAAAVRERPDLAPRPEWVFVDDLQDATPAHLELLELLAGGGRRLIAAACPDEAVFGYQGGDPEAVRDFPDRLTAPAGTEAPVIPLRSEEHTSETPVTCKTPTPASARKANTSAK